MFNQNNVLNFDEVAPSKSSPIQTKVKESIPEPPTKIDFFGVDDQNDDKIDLDKLEQDFN